MITVTGTATVTISGVIDQTSGILGLGTSNAATASGGVATVSIANGGELNLNNISGNPGTPSIQAGSQILISEGGLLSVKGDQVGNLGDYISAGEIVGVGGSLQVSFDSDSNLTSVTVIPEPSVVALLTVLSLGLCVSRRRS
ncbi:PEP-CTERM sorting domain-containing protein [Haloferula sp. A504]|uniref:PEP-CTERM sorting domain-containing protein n=1 Tax=Haloferula sp. A504 TaxID=3373601 RepID=UPI0031BC85BC|nr:PEP-CTERM sorting domain-containing protein [Verrucomicrobiaceae bacterium E54]